MGDVINIRRYQRKGKPIQPHELFGTGEPVKTGKPPVDIRKLVETDHWADRNKPRWPGGIDDLEF